MSVYKKKLNNFIPWFCWVVFCFRRGLRKYSTQGKNFCEWYDYICSISYNLFKWQDKYPVIYFKLANTPCINLGFWPYYTNGIVSWSDKILFAFDEILRQEYATMQNNYTLIVY